MIRRFLQLNPAFQVNIIFFALMSFLIIIFSEEVPKYINFLIIFSSMIIFQLYTCSMSNFPLLILIRNVIFPVLSVIIAFDTVGFITPYLNSDIDHILLNLDYMILGFYPYIYFQKFTYPLLTDLMQISYCVYYFLPFMIGFYLIIKGKMADFYRVLFLILLCYYLSYIGYILFPALGPRYSIQNAFDIELKGFLFANKINNFLNFLEGIKRDAFPSGHVGISLLILILFYKYDKKIFKLILVPVTLLIISTIYCRYHYFVDVIAGIILAFVTLIIGNLYYNFWLKRNEITLYKE